MNDEGMPRGVSKGWCGARAGRGARGCVVVARTRGQSSRAALASGCGGASQFNRFDIRLELVIGRTNERAPRTRTSGRD